MGGNDTSQYRFLNAVIRDNVFTDIGRSQPTTRTLTWYIDLIDNDGTEVVGNLLVNQPGLGNGYGIAVSGGSERGVNIHDNVIYGVRRRALWSRADAGWDSVAFRDNTVVSTSGDDCLISVDGGTSALTFERNAYRSSGAADSWFCVDGMRSGLGAWMSSTEASAITADSDPPEPTRNLDSYAASLGIGSTLADYAASARLLSRHTYRPELTAPNAANYIRAGFGVAPH